MEQQLIQQQAQHPAEVPGELPVERFLQLRNLLSQLRPGQIGQPGRVVLPLDHGLQHQPSGHTHHVGGHRTQLHVGVFKQLLNAIADASGLQLKWRLSFLQSAT